MFEARAPLPLSLGGLASDFASGFVSPLIFAPDVLEPSFGLTGSTTTLLTQRNAFFPVLTFLSVRAQEQAFPLTVPFAQTSFGASGLPLSAFGASGFRGGSATNLPGLPGFCGWAWIRRKIVTAGRARRADALIFVALQHVDLGRARSDRLQRASDLRGLGDVEGRHGRRHIAAAGFGTGCATPEKCPLVQSSE